MKRIIEIRAAEGGADSQIFVGELAGAFVRFADRHGWSNRVVRDRPSDAGHYEIALELTGADLSHLHNESGGHRIQRVPPTERRGRVHSSTVTVAVIDPAEAAPDVFGMIEDSDFRIEWFSGTVGAGGQHRNRHANSCRCHHVPTGIVESRQGRKREANLRDAKAALIQRLRGAGAAAVASVHAGERRSQVGSGMRGDKAVTLRFQADQAVNHRSGRTMAAARYMRGHMDEIW